MIRPRVLSWRLFDSSGVRDGLPLKAVLISRVGRRGYHMSLFAADMALATPRNPFPPPPLSYLTSRLFPHRLPLRRELVPVRWKRRHAPQIRLTNVCGNQRHAGDGEASFGDTTGILYFVRETAAKPSMSALGGALADGSTLGGGHGGSGAVGGNPRQGSGPGGRAIEVDGKPNRYITVTNLRPRKKVVIAVVNVSMYFSVIPVIESAGSSDVANGCATAASGEHGQAARGVRRLKGSPDGDGFRGRSEGLGGLQDFSEGMELFEVPAGGSLTLCVSPRLEKLRSGKGPTLLANEQSIEVRLREGARVWCCWGEGDGKDELSCTCSDCRIAAPSGCFCLVCFCFQ